MARGLSSAFKTAIGASVVYPAFFAEFQFDSGTTRFWTGDTNINTDLGDGSVTWTGGGMVGRMSFSGEGESIQARNLTFELNGVDQSYYATAIATQYRGRPVRVWFAAMNSAHDTVAYSYLLEEARMDQLSIAEQDGTIVLTLTCESRLVDMFRPRRTYLNNDTHHKAYPDDDFYEFVPKLPGMRLPWGLRAPGRQGTSTQGGYQGGGSGSYGSGGGLSDAGTGSDWWLDAILPDITGRG